MDTTTHQALHSEKRHIYRPSSQIIEQKISNNLHQTMHWTHKANTWSHFVKNLSKNKPILRHSLHHGTYLEECPILTGLQLSRGTSAILQNCLYKENIHRLFETGKYN